MSLGWEGSSRRYREGLFSGISAGLFFVLVGALFFVTPNLFDRVTDFFRDFDIVRVPNLGIWLLAPASPSSHSALYLAVERFSYVWGFFQIAFLVLRFVARSPLPKKAETLSNVVFWLGAGFLTGMFLKETTILTEWFVFWAGLVMLLGLSLIVRSIVLAATPMRHST